MLSALLIAVFSADVEAPAIFAVTGGRLSGTVAVDVHDDFSPKTLADWRDQADSLSDLSSAIASNALYSILIASRKSLTEPELEAIRQAALEILADPKHPGAVFALKILAEAGKKDDRGAVVRSTASKHPKVRAAAFFAIAKLGGDESVPALTRAAAADRDADARKAAVAALGEIGTPKAKLHLERLYRRNADPALAEAIARSLDRIR